MRLSQREAALREILEAISGSRNDEQPVFDAILKNARLVCDAPLASLYLVDDARAHATLAASLGARSDYLDNADRKWTLDDGSSVSRAISEERVVHIADIADTALYRSGDRQRVDAVDIEGIRTFLAVPLISAGVAIGAIGLYRREVQAFSDSQVEMVRLFAEQAVIAIDNARQFRELQARLEREAATREILQVISRSRDDELPVFEAILENARRLCEATMAAMVMGSAQDAFQSMVAHRGASDATVELYRSKQFPMDPEISFAAQAIIEERVVHLEDMADTQAYRDGRPQTRALVDEQGIRTNLFVPLIGTNGAIGAFILFRTEVRPFSDAQIALVETFAEQAVIAIENVRQFRELQTRLEREAATREILEVISRSRDDERPVFDTILESASRLCAAPLAFLSMANEARTHVTVPAHLGARPEFAAALTRFDEPMAGSELVAVRAVTEARVIRSDDLIEDPAFPASSPWRKVLVETEGVRSILIVPLLRGEEGIGAIILYRREVAPFSDDDLALVQGFAAQAVIAVDNVRQFRALRDRTEDLRVLNVELESRVAEQVGELERMARLKRFLSPQVADAVVSSGGEALLGSHRALIAVMFCDIRGFTAFCETAEPEETIEVLQTYHEEMGKLIHAHGAGVDHRWGDGIMAIFNDPLACDDPAGDALRMAVAMRARMAELCGAWKRLGHKLGFGVGIALGYATVGMVGSEGRYDYTANGTAVNLAARLCDEAADGEILLSPRAYAAVEDGFEAVAHGELTLKGIQAPVEVFRVTDAKGG